MNKFIFVTTAVLISFLFVGAMYGTSFAQNKSSSQATNQTSGGGAGQSPSANQTSMGSQSKGNASAGGIGSIQELTKAIGNNSQIFANNTSIGNPNASMAEKMSGESNATNQTKQYASKGNITGTISGSLNKTAESANKTLSQLGKNVSEAAPGILNKTGEVAKKIIGGAADVIKNITSEIKKGVGAK